MPAGCNCGPNSSLARALGCHCLRRGTAVIASQLPLPRLKSAAVQDCKWRYIKCASFTFTFLPDRFVQWLSTFHIYMYFAKRYRDFGQAIVVRTKQVVRPVVGHTMSPPLTLTFDLLTLKVVSESRVTWSTSVPILVFLDLSVVDLGPMYETDREYRAPQALNADAR